ncbi:MAG: protein PilO [Desulfobacterales bacterium CG23_combo_of_CG06-09_8_20_14_all_51_8]|nr:MAG: protein PilO [Desulfobacterales bacterium CG23_combo_of_CG06-09_8_20_14_all_51_8]
MKKPELSLNSIEPLIQKISELTKVQRIIICCVSVALILGGCIYFLYMPKYEAITKLKKEISEQEDKLTKTKANAQQLAQYQQKLEEAQAKFNIVARALPLSNEVPSLLTGVSQIGKDAGLSFLLFKPEPEVVKEFYAELPITMNLSGTYHDLGMFFDQLAGMDRIVNVKKFDMTFNEGSPLTIACTAETYKFVETQPAKVEEGKDQKNPKK